MLHQVFRKNVDQDHLFELLDKCCIKTEKYYLLDLNAYRKMVFHQYHTPFLEGIVEHYHLSKQFYVTRKLTYNSFTNIVRQICKSNGTMFTNNIKYNKSEYNIDYLIYF